MVWRHWPNCCTRKFSLRLQGIQVSIEGTSKVFIVGVGPGSFEWVSRRVQELVKSADILVGWEQDFVPIKDLILNQRIFLQECSNYLEIPVKAASEAKNKGLKVVVLKTGDPLVAPAGLNDLLKIFQDFEVTIIPGISSVQLAAAKVGITLYDSAIITYHPLPHDGGSDLRRKRKRMLEAVNNGLNLIVLTGVRQLPHQTAEFLLSKGIDPATKTLIFENLTYPDEKRSACRLDEVVHGKFNWLSVTVILSGIKAT
ncbi:MAG: precorrin-6y C5,15-methyltransferase (decarboxylating) subunit CbiE [Dehalogenimonas sp.]